MSAEEDGRTEQASPRRLQQARDEGQVPIGHDAAMVASLAAGLGVLVLLAVPLRDSLQRLVEESARNLPATPFAALPSLAARPGAMVAAACAAAGIAGVGATLLQTGAGFWPHLALPDLSRVFQPGALARLFRKEFAVDLLLAAVKVVALGWAAFGAARDDFVTLAALLAAPAGDQLPIAAKLLAGLAWRLLLVAALIAGVDVAVQRFRFGAKMRMTRDELKREAKEEEGDPLLKGKRKQRHRDLAKGRAAVEVPRADLLLVNPTHVAVALRYRREDGSAPRLTAKGKGALAEHMRELARANGVAIVQDVPLARLLYRRVKVGREIPEDTYKAVAAVLAFVYRLTARQPSKETR